MRIRVTDAGGTRELPLEIEDGLVMQGRSWRRGAAIPRHVILDPFTEEWVCYAINEGHQLFAEADDVGGTCPVLRFAVVEATRNELQALDLLGSAPPEGSEIKTDDGRTFWTRFGRLVDGETSMGSMTELKSDFTMSRKLTPHLQMQERVVALQAMLAKLADVEGNVMIRDGLAYFPDGKCWSLRTPLKMADVLRAMVGGPKAVNVTYLPPAPAADTPLRQFFDRLTRALVQDRALIEIGDRRYRFAGQGESFIDGELECTPAATGIFVRNPVTHGHGGMNGAHGNFRWMYLCSSDDLEQVLRGDVEGMTEAQRDAVLVNLAFGKALRQVNRPRG